MILTENKELVGAFVASRVKPGEFVPWGNFSVLGLAKGRRLVAGIVYNHYSPPNICMNVAGEEGGRWMTPEFLFAAFDYPFNALGLARVTAFIAASNKASLRLTEKVGFTQEGCLRKALPDGSDQLVFGMLKEECKWISNDFAMRLEKRFKLRGKAISHA